MEQINITVLQNFLKELQNVADFFERYSQINERYRIGVVFVPKKKILDWCKSINKRERKHYQRQLKQNGKINYPPYWSFGEWKVFSWIAISMAVLHSKDFSQLQQTQIERIGLFFNLKKYDFVKFQFLALLNKSLEANRAWQSDQIRILTEIVQNYPEKEYNWRDITLQLFVKSDHRYYRGVNKCKEKWLNYLNPNLLRESWSMEQDLLMVRLVREVGPRWALISQKMNHCRTEHMVKNRYTWYRKNWRRYEEEDQADLLDKIYAHIKQKKRLLHQKAKREGDKEIFPFLNRDMDVKMEADFLQPDLSDNKDVKLQPELIKEDEAMPSSRVSVNMQAQPVLKCEQMEELPIKNQQGYYPFFPYYQYVPAHQVGIVPSKADDKLN